MTPPTATSRSMSTSRSARRVAALATALALALATALCAGACSGGSGAPAAAAFDGPPLLEVTSTPGALRLSLRASPSPPQRGLDELELTVVDAAGRPLDGLSIEIVPWMPAMGHGVSVVPTIRGLGDGVYLVRDVSLPMAGRWSLRTRLTRAVGATSPTSAAASATETAELGIDVE